MKTSASIGSLLVSLTAVTLLAGCGGEEVTYVLDINVTDPGKRAELIDAAERVVERRLETLGQRKPDVAFDVAGDTVLLMVNTESPAIQNTLTAELTAPFSMRIMNEVKEGGDITVEGHGSFKEAGVTEEHLNWVTASKDVNPEKGRVVLEFTEEGRTAMADIFRQNKGKYIGLFVRQRLVSKLLVESDEVKDSIVITDIPSSTLAFIFADDLNVGLHVTFLPQEQ